MMTHEEALSRARRLVGQMTVEEKVSQVMRNSAAVPRLGIPAYTWWNEALHGVARAGTATVFPQAIALAASFDTEQQRAVGDVIATEGRAKYNAQSALGDRDIYKGLTFWSPNVNIFRDPRWGRGQETYGEDPYLTSRMGVAFVRGVQGEGEHLKAAACAKHLAVHSGPEEIRHGFDAVVSKKDLRETYLPAFEALVKEADVESVMGAYNAVNGEPSCLSPVLQTILREEWGFQGHMVSDAGAIDDLHNYHHITKNAAESAAMSLKAGCDLNCGHMYNQLLQAFREGLVTESEIDRACERVLASRIRLGLLDGGSEYDGIGFDQCDTDEHDALALQAARRGMVLLKNDGVLPLSAGIGSLAVIGPDADSVVCLEGNYNGTSSRYVTLLRGLRAACRERNIRVYYSLGCHLYRDRTSNLAQADDRLAEAKACALAADVVVLCVGLDSTIEGEQGDASNEFSSGDKKDLRLPESQRRLMEAVLETGKPVVTVLCAGSALAVDEGNAVVQAWYPGQAGGTALADILFGTVSPSGRLPVTVYRSVNDLPDFADYAMKGRTYRYFEGEPLYPFGYGLSYTSFAYSDPAYENGAVSVTVKNTGDMDGGEVVEVYVRPLHSAFAAPNPSLCAFARIELKKGEEKRVSLPIRESAFEVVNDDGERVRDTGEFVLYVGGSQPDPRSACLTGAQPAEIRLTL